MEATAAQHVGRPRRQGRDKAIGQAEFAAQGDGRAFLREQRIGSTVDHPSIESIGADDATKPIGGFEEQHVDAAPM